MRAEHNCWSDEMCPVTSENEIGMFSSVDEVKWSLLEEKGVIQCENTESRVSRNVDNATVNQI